MASTEVSTRPGARKRKATLLACALTVLPLAAQAQPKCKTDWRQCHDNTDLATNFHGTRMAAASCHVAAIDQARYGTPTFPLVPFGVFRTGTDGPRTGMITLIENDAKFQNSFGAMARAKVTCRYNLSTETVVSITITAEGA